MKRSRDGRLAPACALAFAAVLCLLAMTGYMSWLVPAWHAAMSIVVLALYAADKRAAVEGRRRVPERRLHWLALAGGWPGALAGQRLLRHKTRKQPFQGWFVASACGNCLVLLVLHAWAGHLR